MLPQEETCPVDDSLFGDLYRSSPEGLHALVETIPANVRAMLALYCYRRSHLSDLAIAVASTCEWNELVRAGGELGKHVFDLSRKAPEATREKRRKITLASGSAFSLLVAQDLV
jgi:hypothetical protein